MDLQGPKRQSSARERQMARKQRRKQKRQTGKPRLVIGQWLKQAQLGNVWDVLRDIGWTIRSQPGLGRNVALAVVGMLGVYLLTYTLTGRIYPRVQVMGVNLGGMSAAAAEDVLREAWQSEVELAVMVDGVQRETVRPSALGFRLDAAATAQQARQEVNWREGFFGVNLTPVVELPEGGYLVLQNYLLDITPEINTPAMNAGFAWEGGALVAVPGQTGQVLDIAPTLAAVQENPSAIVRNRQLDVYVSPVPPEVMDSSGYLARAAGFVNSSFTIEGYDPYQNDTMRWSTNQKTLASWLEVNADGLSLRRSAFAPFLEAQVNSLNADGEQERYLDTQETMEMVEAAIAEQQSQVTLRVRYTAQTYTVAAGDTANAIARKTGIPYYMIERENPGRDLNVLSIGDTVKIPTRDVTMPHDPIPGKRIVVDLNSQELWAYENGDVMFNWSISSGRSNAPTSPGIYQILNHEEKAYGGSYTLCDDLGCGQWEMSWFMGIYEVTPGLVNGFHGAVLLPNGTYLNGGAVGFPSTFGCVMSPNDAARELYEWAEVGTVVEIISNEFDPMSDLAARTQSQPA